MHDFEANYLKLVEKLCDGCHIDINETGTKMRFKPGILVGGRVTLTIAALRALLAGTLKAFFLWQFSARRL